MRLRARAVVWVACAAALACARSGTSPQPGQTDFVSRPPGGSRGGAADGAGGAGTPTAAPATPESGTTRDVTEGDLYAFSGSAVLVLNGTRGLLAVDVADPARPRLVSRVPLTGRPVELYVRDGVALFTVSDWWGWGIAADGAVEPRTGSQLWAVDVRDPAAPRVLATLPVAGTLVTSRVAGRILYVVSRTAPQWWFCGPGGACPVTGAPGGVPAVAASDEPASADEVAVTSFDLTDPAAPRQVAREAVALPQGTWSVFANMTAARLTLAWPSWTTSPVTRFLAFDVSDPAGAIARGAAWEAPGTVQDRWSLDHDDANGVFRAVLADGWSAGATLRTWRSARAQDVPAPLGTLPLAVPERLTAARFDGPRAYVVTAVQRDPLWAIDVADPAAPVLRGHLEMPGQLDFIEPRGDRLVALGHTNEAGKPWQLHVSLFDVAAPAPALLSRVLVGGDYAYVNAGSDDLRKAFQVLDGDGLVLVPFQSWDRTAWTSKGGTQLVDLSRDALALRGFVAGAGAVLRAFPVPGRPATLAAFSDERLQTIDAADRSAPRELAALDLARPVWDVAVAGDHLVELSGAWWSGAAELVTAPAADPDAPVPSARVALGHEGAQLFQRGAISWILTRDWRTGGGAVTAYDVSAPASPRSRGSVALDGSGYGWSWAALAADAPVLALFRWSWGATPAGAAMPAGALSLYDLSDPDAPRLASTVPLGDTYGWDLRWSGSTLAFTRFEWTDASAGWGRFWLERIDARDPAAPRRLAPLNVPGQLLALDGDGARAYTLDTVYEDAAAPRTALRALDLGEKATLRGTVEIAGWIGGGVVHGGHAYLVASGPGSDPPRLVAVDLAAMRTTSDEKFARGWAWPVGATGARLLLATSTPSQGVLVFDLADPGRPSLLRTVETAGGVYAFAADAERAYLAGGPYGVAVVPLGR